MIDKDSLLNDKEFLKSFKDGLELQSFFRELQARAVSQMLEGEMDGHLGYEKHERSGQGNSRNGHTSKKVRGDQGDLEIQVPRDRDGSFNPIIVPKHKNMIDGVENVIVSLYAKGMSVSDKENMMRDVYGFDLSESTISRITDRVAGDVIAWQNRPLDNVYLIVWMDGMFLRSDTPEMVTKKQSTEIRDLIHSLQPECIINRRLGNGLGDYTVVEQSLVSQARKNWEACITMSENWGYNRHDKEWKSPELLVRNLVEVVSKGGNLLLNIGSKGDGTWPQESLNNLRAIGNWMKVNGEALYGTFPWKVAGEDPSPKQVTKGNQNDNGTMKDAVNDATPKEIVSDVRFTTKDKYIYVFVRSPNTSSFSIANMAKGKIEIENVKLLGSSKN